MKITTQKLIDAIEKNGYRKANGQFIVIKKEAQHKYTAAELEYMRGGSMLPKDNDDVYAACAMGQAGLNLNIEPVKIENDHRGLVVRWNDLQNMSLKKIATALKERVNHEKGYLMGWRGVE